MKDFSRDQLSNTIETLLLVRQDEQLLDTLVAAAEITAKALQRGKKLLVAGNGGSAADAQHLAAEFVGRFTKDRPAMRAVALTTDTSCLTGIGNDYGYERVFDRQIEGAGAARRRFSCNLDFRQFSEPARGTEALPRHADHGDRSERRYRRRNGGTVRPPDPSAFQGDTAHSGGPFGAGTHFLRSDRAALLWKRPVDWIYPIVCGPHVKRAARIGIDWGGTKIEVLAMDHLGVELRRERISTPRYDYEASIRAATELLLSIEREIGEKCPVGVGIPGMIDPVTGLVRNANSTWLNGKPLQRDLGMSLGREVRCMNDANCLALSEAVDGAGTAKHVVFAVILGTGCGAGLAIDAKVHCGINRLAGEWGHNPLPWQRPEEYPGRPCYCGQSGCIEGWISGTGLEDDHRESSGISASGAEIVQLSEEGDPEAQAALVRYEDRLARALAHVVNMLDPDVIVLGGGLSRVEPLYDAVPPQIVNYVFGKIAKTPVCPAVHGDSSGVRGAARLWPLDKD